MVRKRMKFAWALAGAMLSAAAIAGTDLTPYVADGTLTIPATTTIAIDDGNAAAFGAVDAVVFAATSSKLTFANTTQIVAGQTFSGKGVIAVLEGGKLKFTGDNSAYTGNMTVSNANVVAASRQALGKANITTYNYNKDPFQLEFDGEQTTDASIYVINAAQFQRDPSQTVTFNGTMRQGTSELAAYNLGNVVMTGTLRNENKQQKLCMLGNGEYHAYINSFRYGSNFQMEGDGWVHMTKKPELFGLALTLMSKIKLVCGAKDCLNVPANGILFRDNSSSTSPRRIDLGGYDQTLRYVASYLVTIAEGSKVEELITSSTPAQFIVKNLCNQSRSVITEFTYPFRFNGAAGLTCNIPAASRINLINIVSDTTGTLEVKSGTLELKWKAGWGGTNVVVSGGTLVCNSANAITNDQARLVISAGALQNNVDLHVGSANIGGQELAAGTYTSADFPDHLTGGAKLYVNYYAPVIVYKTYHWTGGGDDDLLTNKDNWQEAEVPDFSAPGATLIFDGNTRSRAVADGELSVHHIVLAGSHPFTLAAADDAAVIHLGTETEDDTTIFVSNAAPNQASIPTNVIAVALHTTSAQREFWKVSPYTAVDFRGKLSGSGSASIELNPLCLPNSAMSYGAIILSGDNSGMVRPFNLRGGKFLARHENALGSSTRGIKPTGGSGTLLKFDCLTNNVPIDSPGSSYVLNDFGQLSDRPEGLVMNGRFTGGTGMSLNIGGTTFRGGLTCQNLQASGNGRVETTGVSLSGVQAVRQGAGTFTLAAHGNSWTCWNLVETSSRLMCADDNVLVAARCIHFGEWNSSNRGTLDLNGYDQACGGFARYMYNGTPVYTKGAADCGEVTSATPATLSWEGTPKEMLGNGDYDYLRPTNQVRFVGQAALRVAASANVRHTVVNVKSTTVGPLAVESGTLVLAWGAGWTATTNVTVSGGELCVEADSAPCAFGPAQGRSKALMTVTGAGIVRIEGGQATVRTLSLDGEAYLPAGVYGSSESGAPNPLACLKGAGTLKVSRSTPVVGFGLVIR